MTKIIGFAGRKQSGKTTASSVVKNIYTQHFGFTEEEVKIYNFADLLKKDICMNILGLSHEQCYGEDEHKNSLTDLEWQGKKLTAREVMQFVGTEIFRKMKQDVWAAATIQQISKDNPKIAIIADCRFPNEVNAIKSAGGIVIKLMLNPFNSDHESETALDTNKYNYRNFDIVIFNNNLSIEAKDYAIFDFLNKKGFFKL